MRGGVLHHPPMEGNAQRYKPRLKNRPHKRVAGEGHQDGVGVETPPTKGSSGVLLSAGCGQAATELRAVRECATSARSPCGRRSASRTPERAVGASRWPRPQNEMPPASKPGGPMLHTAMVTSQIAPRSKAPFIRRPGMITKANTLHSLFPEIDPGPLTEGW